MYIYFKSSKFCSFAFNNQKYAQTIGNLAGTCVLVSPAFINSAVQVLVEGIQYMCTVSKVHVYCVFSTGVLCLLYREMSPNSGLTTTKQLERLYNTLSTVHSYSFHSIYEQCPQ